MSTLWWVQAPLGISTPEPPPCTAAGAHGAAPPAPSRPPRGSCRSPHSPPGPALSCLSSTSQPASIFNLKYHKNRPYNLWLASPGPKPPAAAGTRRLTVLQADVGYRSPQRKLRFLRALRPAPGSRGRTSSLLSPASGGPACLGCGPSSSDKASEGRLPARLPASRPALIAVSGRCACRGSRDCMGHTCITFCSPRPPPPLHLPRLLCPLK